MFENWIRGYCRLLSVLMVASLGVMVLMVFGNVVLRYGFNTGITLSEELSRWLFVWLTFLGAVVGLQERAHLGTDSLIARLPRRGQQICLGLTYGCMLVLCAMVFKGSWEQVKINLESTSAVMEVSMGWFYASGMVFAVLAAPILLSKLWALLTGRLADSELIGIRESDDMPHGQAES